VENVDSSSSMLLQFAGEGARATPALSGFTPDLGPELDYFVPAELGSGVPINFMVLGICGKKKLQVPRLHIRFASESSSSARHDKNMEGRGHIPLLAKAARNGAPAW
jgi:hypothetical protein